MLSFLRVLACVGFEEFSEKKKKMSVSLSWKKSGSILLHEMMQSPLRIQISPNVNELLLIPGLSSGVIPVLSFEQSCVSAKTPVKCFNSRKNIGTEKV